MTPSESLGPLVRIGTVRSPWPDTHSIPVQGGPATIELEPQYEPALECIERASHLVVIAYLHRADRSVLKASPRKLKCNASPCGVFATRSPARPNPLSVTMVQFIKRDGLVLHVTPLDLLDGTPVVDLKAYSPGWDSVFAAQTVRRVASHQLSDELLIAFLQRDLHNHIGERAFAPQAQATLHALVRVIRRFELDPRDPALHVEVNGYDICADALMGMTGACFSNGRLAVHPDDGPRRVRFFAAGREHTETIT